MLLTRWNWLRSPFTIEDVSQDNRYPLWMCPRDYEAQNWGKSLVACGGSHPHGEIGSSAQSSNFPLSKQTSLQHTPSRIPQPLLTGAYCGSFSPPFFEENALLWSFWTLFHLVILWFVCWHMETDNLCFYFIGYWIQSCCIRINGTYYI